MPDNREPTDAEALLRRVQERAYALWECEGGTHGHELDHWLQAEAEIRETGSSVAIPSPTVSPADRKAKAGTSSD